MDGSGEGGGSLRKRIYAAIITEKKNKKNVINNVRMSVVQVLGQR